MSVLLHKLFSRPGNFDEQIDLSKKLAIIIAVPVTFFLFLMVVSHWIDGLPIRANHLAPVVLLFLISGLITLLLLRLKQLSSITLVLKSFMLLPLAGFWAVYLNGYLAFNFFPLFSLLMLISYRGRFRLVLPYLALVTGFLIESFSPVQFAQEYVIRLTVATAVIIWPINTLLDGLSFSQDLRKKALSQVFQVTFLMALILFLYIAIYGKVSPIPNLISVMILLFIVLWLKREHSRLTLWKGRFLGGLFVLIYFYSISLNQFIAAMLLPAYIVLLFLILPLFQAFMMSIGLLVFAVNGYFSMSGFDFEFEPLPFFSRFVINNMIFTAVILQLVIKLTAKDQNQKQLNSADTLKVILLFLGFATVSGLLIYWSHDGFSRQFEAQMLTQKDINLLTINAFLWLLLTWIATSFALNYKGLEKMTQLLGQSESQLLADLKAQNQQRAKLFAMIGHELRTPAATLKMLLAQNDSLSSKQLQNQLNETVEHLLNVIDDMSVVNHPEQAIKGKNSLTSVDKVVRELISIQDRLLLEQGLKVSIHADANATQLCFFNAQLFRQIVLNLLKNAALHGNAHHIQITLKTHRVGDFLSVDMTFADDGQGIKEADQQRLFNAFERGDSQAEGTGLGLYLSQQFAREALQGDLQYDASYQDGACFKLNMLLPMANQSDMDQVSEYASLDNMHILLAEDNLTLKQLTVDMLQKHGAIVTAVSNGLEASELLKSQSFDLLLTDAFMPEIDGFELIELAREQGFNQPIVAITAATVGNETERLKKSGADFVLQKPLDFERFARLVGKTQTNFVDEPSSQAVETMPPIPPLTDTALFDYHKLMNNLQHDPLVYQRAVDIFTQETDNFIMQMQAFLDKGDLANLRFVAHQLKGNASSMFAEPLRQQVIKLMQLADEGKAQQIPAELENIRQQVKRLRQALSAAQV